MALPLNPPLDEAALQARLGPTLQTLEAQRQQHGRTCERVAHWCGGFGIGIFAFWAGYGAVGRSLTAWCLAPLVVALLVYATFLARETEIYNSGFKQMVLPTLVAQFGALQYHHGQSLSEDEFNAARLFERPDRFSGQDLIEGRVGVTALRVSEIKAERRETRTDSKGRTSTHYVEFFGGLLLIADFNKHLSSATFVLPENGLDFLGGFGAGLQNLDGKLGGRGALVRLEDPAFEKHFRVYGSDGTQARYVLSSALMSRLVELKAHFKSDISAAFMDQSLYLAIHTGHNWFEAPSLDTPLDVAGLRQLIGELHSVTGIVEALDLNTRIWTKS